MQTACRCSTGSLAAFGDVELSEGAQIAALPWTSHLIYFPIAAPIRYRQSLGNNAMEVHLAKSWRKLPCAGILGRNRDRSTEAMISVALSLRYPLIDSKEATGRSSLVASS